MAVRGVLVDPATLNRWVVRYLPLIASEAKKRKQSVAGSWRMDEIYIKVKGQWTYLYRAIDKYGSTVTSCCPGTGMRSLLRPSLNRP
jgi:putative transposase